MDRDLEFREVRPEGALADFVDSFWMLRNKSHVGKNVIGLPDGRIDLIFSKSSSEPFNAMIIGLNTQPDEAVIAPETIMFVVSFKLLATEYILRSPLTIFANQVKLLPYDFWDLKVEILDDFDVFCKKVSEKIHSLLPLTLDERKRGLTALLYASKGEMGVAELSSGSAGAPGKSTVILDSILEYL